MRTLSKGFTLIELLVVVVLIAVMLAIAIPSFASFIADYRVTTAMNDFLQSVTTTRLEALKRGKYVDMIPKTPGDWKSGWRIIIDANQSHAYDSDGTEEVIFEHDALPTSVTVSDPSPQGFSDASAGAVYIAFDGTGYPKTHGTAEPLTGGIVMSDGSAATPTAKHALCLATYGRPRTFTLPSGVPSCSNG